MEAQSSEHDHSITLIVVYGVNKPLHDVKGTETIGTVKLAAMALFQISESEQNQFLAAASRALSRDRWACPAFRRWRGRPVKWLSDPTQGWFCEVAAGARQSSTRRHPPSGRPAQLESRTCRSGRGPE